MSSIFDTQHKPGQSYSISFNRLISGFLDGNASRTVEIVWSPGYEGIVGNERADELAKEAVEQEHMKRAWRREWDSKPKVGRYGISDRYPPSLKLKPHFLALDGEREAFGRLIQCRTGHSFTGEYYSTLVATESTSCPCGELFQTREHILRDCPRYEDYRDMLRGVSRDFSLPEILGTRDGIEALTSEFLRESGAFSKTGLRLGRPANFRDTKTSPKFHLTQRTRATTTWDS